MNVDGETTTERQTAFVYDGNQIALQFDRADGVPLTSSDLSHRYLYCPAVDQILADEQLSPLPPGEGQGEGYDLDEPGDVLWTLNDHLNTVRDLATYDPNTDTTTIVTHRVFDAFGNETSHTGSADCLLGFTGKLFDRDTKIQNNIERWYEATTGKWLSEDPIGYESGNLNLYQYVRNRPLDATDTLGLYEVRPPRPEDGPVPVNHVECQNGKLVPVIGPGEGFCTYLHELIHVFQYPPNVCKNPDGTNKPDGSIPIYDPDDPNDQIDRSWGELEAIAVEMACRSARWAYYRCNGIRGDEPFFWPSGDWNPVWREELMLQADAGYFWNNLVILCQNIQKLPKK